jgi:hypothetical protein
LSLQPTTFWLVAYNGETEHTFGIRYSEHIEAKKADRQNFNYEQCVLDAGYTYKTIKETVDMLHK